MYYDGYGNDCLLFFISEIWTVISIYRMVFLDIDGTLLTSGGKFDPELIETFEKLRRKGVLFGLATGRSVVGAKLYGDQLGCSLYVAYHGALVVANDEPIFQNKIPRDVAHRLCLRTSEWGGTYIHFSEHSSRSNSPLQNIEHLLPIASICELADTQLDAHRLSLYLDFDQRRMLEKEITQVVSFEEEDRLEVYPFGSKWTGILALISSYGISPEEVVTIGNADNDLEMIEGAGLGIAMGNAPEHIKKRAKWITKDNDHHGVSFALQKAFDL